MSEWISVKDLLPVDSYSQRILAYGVPKDKQIPQISEIHFCRFTTKRGFEYGEYDEELQATHWMPLPEPPKEKD